MTETTHHRNRLGLIALAAAILGAGLLVAGAATAVSYRPGILAMLAAAAFGVMSHPMLRSYAFTAWVFVCVATALAYPQSLQEWGGVRLTLMIVPLVQIIMFGMGTTLSIADFSRVLMSPWAVFVGLLLQFCIMPTVAFVIATMFGFDGELAAGIILIGSVAGGVASNLMAYIAGANVALSVTMTSISTLAAPLATPLLMRLFAGRFVPIDTVAMVLSILNMIIVPVLAGLLAHSVLYSPNRWANQAGRLAGIILAAVAVGLVAMYTSPAALGFFAPLRTGVMLGGILMALVASAKLILSVLLNRPNTWMDRALPLVSMAGICAILAIIIAQTYDVLISAGLLLVFAAILHNGVGYGLGYWLARGLGITLGRAGYRVGLCKTPETVINEADCRTVAFEVGMQNGGMATGLAIDILNSHVAALPPNVFGTWMNISGSILANWWKRKDAAQLRAEETADVGAVEMAAM